MFIKVHNRDEYKKVISLVQKDFDCIEDWQDYFGFELKWDEESGEVLETIEEYQGEIKSCPEKYPCIIYCKIDSQRLCWHDASDTKIFIFDWCYEDELNNSSYDEADDNQIDDIDFCYECGGYGDDYYFDEENGEWISACDNCSHSQSNERREYN